MSSHQLSNQVAETLNHARRSMVEYAREQQELAAFRHEGQPQQTPTELTKEMIAIFDRMADELDKALDADRQAGREILPNLLKLKISRFADEVASMNSLVQQLY